MRSDCARACTRVRPDILRRLEKKICWLGLVYTLFVGSFYTVDLLQSRFGSFVYVHASDWFFSFLSHMLLLLLFLYSLPIICSCILSPSPLPRFSRFYPVLALSLLFICPSLSFNTFSMFLAPPELDLKCICTLDLHLACFLHLLCWILFVFVHWFFDCFVSVAILALIGKGMHML